MPRRQGYRRRRGGRRRLSTVALRGHPSRSQMTKYGSVTGKHLFRGVNRAATLYDAATMIHSAAKSLHPLIKDIPPMHGPGAGVRGSGKKDVRGFFGKKHSQNKNRHEKYKQAGTVGPVAKGKGFNTTAVGKVTTHGRGVVPKWKTDRLRKYKNDVWQTVLISKSNRLAASNNVLETVRYPIAAPAALDSERVQSMIFSPFCSHYSGIHSTMFRKVASSGTDIDHDTSQLLDVVQNRADIARQSLPISVDGTGNSAIMYEGIGGDAASARAQGNRDQIHNYYDQLMKKVKVDLVFTASRAFPVKVSVCVVRHINATSPYTMTADDKKMLLNNLTNVGMEYRNYRTEWLHQFTLPALRNGKKPPQYSVNKTLNTNFLQSNTFEKNNVAQAMTQSNTTQLGKSIDIRINEAADGDVSGMFYVLIKYRKAQTPTQFQYKQAVSSNAGRVVGEISVPFISDESFDVPTATGFGIDGQSGAPMGDHGDESKASFYLHGKLTYRWGFRRETESIPSIISSVRTNADWKKSASLMVDPTYFTDNTYGIYTRSPDHVELADSTANDGEANN